VREQIAERLARRVQEVVLRQYVRLLAGAADIRGVDLDAAPSPLLQ
jgi:peptidyl-prolyl cis-trans isomerase C